MLKQRNQYDDEFKKCGQTKLSKSKAGTSCRRRSGLSSKSAVQLTQEIYGVRRKNVNGYNGRRTQGAPAGKRRIENGARHAKKSGGLLCEAPEVKYRFIFEHSECPKAKWAAQMKVSRSGYYHWKRTRAQREKRKCEYAERVRRVFMAGEWTYGASRICGRLRTEGFSCSFYKVRDSMEMQGLRSIHRKKRRRSLTGSRKARGDGYANLTRSLQIDAPFQVLSSDISYIRTGEGFDSKT